MGSTAFFVFSLGLFVFHALWVAFSSNLLPYDEYYHIATIKQYALQWSPFISSQPTEGIFYGDITRLHSYLYHYLMSFPYRFFEQFTQNEDVLLVLLRILNIAMVVGGVVLFRRLFITAGISKRLIHAAVAFFVMTPFVVMLSAQNNYDNLMFLLVPVFFHCAYNIVKKSRLEVLDLLYFTSLGMLITLVKHGFALILLITAIFVLSQLLLHKRKDVLKNIATSVRQAKKSLLIIAAVLLVVSGGLFIERHGINLYRYGTINVSCIELQSQSVCENYSPWRRNNNIKNNPPQDERYGNPVSFAQHWVATIMSGLYAIFANIPKPLTEPDPYGHYVFRPLLPLPVHIAYVVVVLSIVAVIKMRKKVMENQLLKMFLFISVLTLSALFLFNYRTYLNLGRAYALQVRYALPILLPMMVLCAWALNQLFITARYKKQVVVIVLMLYMIGGGAVGWIIRSDSSWYLKNDLVLQVNQSAQEGLKKVIPH